MLKRLAEGKVYKQIALELGLSTSTVRTHLHNVVREARRGRPRPGGSDRLRARLALTFGGAAMAEQTLQEKQFDLLYAELRRIADELETIQRRLAMLEALPAALQELSRLSRSIESLAYAALGREGPRLRRRA